VGKTDLEYQGEVEQLQRLLRTRHEELGAAEPDTAAYRAQRTKVFAATTQLLDFEAQIPVLLDEQRWRFSRRIIYVAGGIAVALMLGTGGLIAAGWFSRWHLLPVIVVALAAVAIALSEPGAKRSGHRGRAAGAVIAVACAVLVVVVVARLVSAFWLLALLPLLVAALVCWLQDGTGTEDAA
jgi:peptidoglycan/LPS O-acetylase OafA/YrhL